MECLQRQAEGEKISDIAAERGVNRKTLYSRIEKLQEYLREHARQIGALVVLFLLGSVCVVVRPQPCLADLDRARTFDPAGDADPVVQAARQDANTALGSLSVLKPGEKPWTPTGVRPYAAWAAR